MGQTPMRPVLPLHPPRAAGSWLRLASAGLALACGSCRHPPPTQLVVGIQSDPMGGVVSALHIVIRQAGALVVDELLKPPRGSRVGFPQPWEKTLIGTRKRGRSGRRRGRRRWRPGSPGAAHQAPLVHALRARTHGAPARCARVPVYRVPGDAARGEQGPGAAQWTRVHGPGHLHHGGLPAVRRSCGSARALRP